MNQNYLEMQKVLTETLGLKFPPVAVSIIRRPIDLPKGVPELEKPMFYCAMVKHAMNGNVFFAREGMHGCKRGAAALGLGGIPEDERTGEFYVNKSSFESLRAATRTVVESPALEAGSVYATLLAPLGMTPMDPDVVLVEASPRRVLELIHAAIFRKGGWVSSTMSAPRQVCGALTVRPYLGDINVSIACESARMAAKQIGLEYADEGLIIGIPTERMRTIAENIGRIGYVKMRQMKK
ncbi:MAG: DUF169 domain-containing protein [Candidatus Methanosuratincola sp.]